MISNKYVLVTGACGGLGKDTVEILSHNGYKIIALDKNIVKYQDDVYYFNCDITDYKRIQEVYNEVYKITKSLYAIINLCGIYKMDSVYEGDINKLKDVIDVNFYGIYMINQTFAKMLCGKGKRIINCTSELAGYSAIPFNGFYSLSKVILDSYSDTLRRELMYLDIKVIKVQAGSFSTKLLDGASSEYDNLLNNTKYYKNQMVKLKYMMDRELSKERDPKIFGKLILKIMNKKNPKICYHIKRSLKLRIMSALPERMQDKLYKSIVK